MTDSLPGLRKFGPFEIDFRSGDLRRLGRKVKLQEQPFRALAVLVEHAGEVVTREELRKSLWPEDTFVDFERGLNKAINKLRAALRDDAEKPSYIETLPQRGYRFIAPVELVAPAQPAETAAVERGTSAGRFTAKSKSFARGMAAGALVLGALAVWATVGRAPGAPRVVQFTRLTNDGQAKNGPLASDGSRIYFNEILADQRTQIVQVSVTGGEAVPLAVPLARPELLDLSKDGTEALVANGEGFEQFSLWLQPVVGGAARRVGTAAVIDARFVGDGTRIIYSSGNEVFTANRDGSSAQKLVTVQSVPFGFHYSPDGRALRFTQFDYRLDQMNIMEASADGKGVRQMLQACCGTWTADGRYYLFQTRSTQHQIDLWAAPEGKRWPWRRGDHKAVQLTAGPINFERPLPSADGKKIFAIGKTHRAEVIRYDGRSRQFVNYFSGISAEGLAFTRDGEWVAYTTYPEGILWRSRADGSERRQLTFAPLRALLPRWSPDGKQIAFNAMRQDAGETWKAVVISREGGTPRALAAGKESQIDVNWSPDGGALVFGTHAVPGRPIFVVDAKSGGVLTLPGSVGLFSPRWSPDGKYIAALTTERPYRLMLFDVGAKKWTVLTETDSMYPSFSGDGKYIYFQDWRDPQRHTGERIARLRLGDGRIETTVEIEKVGRRTLGTVTDWFGLAPDDSPLLARDVSTEEIYGLDVQWP